MIQHPMRPWLAVALSLGVAAGAAAAATSATAASPVVRVSVSTTGDQANALSDTAVISGDGRYVAFTSMATNLSPQDTDFRPDVYVRDREAGTTELVSADLGGLASGGRVDDISADGRYVVFTSWAADLVPNDFNGVNDVFIRDRATGTTELVSVADDESLAQRQSLDASVSRDGRYIAFTSFAPLADEDRDSSSQDVYVRDRHAGTTELVSVTRKGVEGGGKQPSIADGGRFISFTSKNKGLVEDDRNKKHDVFVRDQLKDKTERVSVSSKGDEASKRSFASQIAGAGRFVVFTTEAGNLVEDDRNGKLDVFVHDRNKDKTQLVSVDSAERPAGGPITKPSISADGRYVSFNAAADLREGGGQTDALYLRDRSAGTTKLLVSEIGTGAVLSGDGHALSFNAFRSNLVDGDTNNTRDIFTYTW
jgi:Tol biopolymer transport system component